MMVKVIAACASIDSISQLALSVCVPWLSGAMTMKMPLFIVSVESGPRTLSAGSVSRRVVTTWSARWRAVRPSRVNSTELRRLKPLFTQARSSALLSPWNG